METTQKAKHIDCSFTFVKTNSFVALFDISQITVKIILEIEKILSLTTRKLTQ